MRRQTLAITLLAFLIVPRASAEGVRLSDFMEVLGTVTNASSPVSDVVVVAFNLVDYYHSTTRTNQKGAFELSALPAGIYRIVAVKRGFVPAIATIVPNRRDHRVSLRLDRDRVLSAQEKEDIWAIRRALPSDILREVDLVLAAQADDLEATPMAPRFSGEMTSVTGMASDEDVNGFTRTDVGLRGQLSPSWTVDFQGHMRVVSEEPSRVSADGSDAELSGVVMELRSAPGQVYRVASTRGRWLDESGAEDIPSEIETHQLSWQKDESRLELRYQNFANLFRTSGLGESEQVVLAGEKRVFESSRTNVDVQVLLGQSTSVGPEGVGPYRTADLGADATHRFGRDVELSYGFKSRLTEFGTEWSPETRATIHVGRNRALVLSGLYKVFDSEDEVLRFPAVVFLSHGEDVSPRCRYSISFVAGESDDALYVVEATVAEIDSVVRVLFDDRFDEFWDGFYMEEGDVHSALAMSARKNFKDLAVDLSASSGRVLSRRAESSGQGERTYLTGSLQSTYRPSGTSLDITYRYIEQPESDIATENERLLLRMAQSLRLPLDVRVLLGVDVARMVHSGLREEQADPESTQMRLVGGVSVAF